VRILSEVEIWKSARLMIARFGDRARVRAQMRAEACNSRADIDAWVKWMRIAATIIELENGTPHGRAAPDDRRAAGRVQSRPATVAARSASEPLAAQARP
jgi:hypothetical protein